MVLSSDKMSGLRKPMVIIKLETTSAGGSPQESLIELDTDELNSFLGTLKAAQKVKNCGDQRLYSMGPCF